MKIRVYSKQAKEIKEGQVFTAKLENIEGRTIAILESED